MNSPYLTLLVDDEPLAIQRLKRLLLPYGDVIQVIGEAANGAEGLQKAEQLKPELLFLDIEMPVMNGFEMLSGLSFSPIVIFATAFEEYAVRAFEENSVDYLLKPIEPKRLALSIKKLKQQQSQTQEQRHNRELWELLNRLKSPPRKLQSLSVKIGDRILFVKLEEIAYFEADDKYVNLFTLEGKKYLLDTSLSALENKIRDDFTRISRAHLVNHGHLREIQKYFSGKYILILKDQKQTRLTSGASYAENVKNLIEN